jgi:hypothetical protein
MSDAPKTLIFVAVAVLLGAVAWLARPAPFDLPQKVPGETLFDKFGVEDAEALEIVHYDPHQFKNVDLKVARDGENWIIASHNNYPADKSDATTRIRDAALKLADLKILDLYSEVTSDHPLLGVVSPLDEKAKSVETEDIGVLVRLSDGSGKNLAELIVGKKLHPSENDSPRFVRRANETDVFTAEIDVEQFSSKFADWIEPDLLDANASDVRRVALKDFAVAQLPSGEVRPLERMEAVVDWDQKGSKWDLVSLKENRGGRLVAAPLTEDEELNKQKLDDLKSAIDQLKIIDVESKPKEVIEGLASGQDLQGNEKILESLVTKGYVPLPTDNDKVELLSLNGELRFETADAVEYILRFGKETGIESGDHEDVKLNRYLLVSARVAENQLQPPKPEVMPPAAATDDKEPGDAAGAGGQTGEAGEAGAAGEGAQAEGAEDQSPPAEPAADPAEPKDAADPKDEDQPPADEAPDQPPEVTTPPDEAPADGAPPKDDPPADTAEPKVDEIAVKRKAAEEKVAKLNEKFGGWYYIISEDVYKKLHLGRFDVVKTKSEAPTGGLDELQDLGERKPLPPAPDAPAP